MGPKKTIVLASNNAHKLEEIKTLMPGFEVISYSEIFTHGVDVVEDGQTFEENALKKVKAFPVHPNRIYLADDSGLEVEALEGRPGIYSARYGGPGVSSLTQCQLLLAEMALYTERQARFVCVIALLFPSGETQTVMGTVEGHIAQEIAGNQGFGYDPIFIPEGYSQSFSQLGQEVKNRVSHRSKALLLAQKLMQ